MDGKNNYCNATRYPKLVLIEAKLIETSLILMAPGMDQLEIELQSDGEVVDTAIIGMNNYLLQKC